MKKDGGNGSIFILVGNPYKLLYTIDFEKVFKIDHLLKVWISYKNKQEIFLQVKGIGLRKGRTIFWNLNMMERSLI